MSTYKFGTSSGPGGYGGLDLETLIDIADRLTEMLHAEYPGLVQYGEVIQAALAESADDGLPPNRGRIRTSLDTISIGAGAGTGSLAYTQQLVTAFGL
ncbi:hypothetical protein NX794_13105 [Streptomyces sp. LP11]|uniref:Uncharacterized protein n=1 Tax=Streptomyces pyxinicus TaxID=2970331 RepID=A0ABT2B0T9_9ACTN|nr:hypothetical protein [Streptomyces sp. LP11]MCS0602136.1 hypothetical protein [Streptomyces sp. LP11]